MESMKLSEIASALGAEFSGFSDRTVTNVTIDSREAGEGSLFIAIKGDRFDAHDFVPDVLAKGAEAAVCSRRMEGAPEDRIIYVPDTRLALLALAKYYRSKFDIPVVGLTGSVGKTTTKEMVAAVLSQEYKTLATQGNFNNEIGLPKMCFRLDSSIQAAVFEMGMSGFGEISRLTDTARPTVGIITNIGVSHIEMLGSREGILKAKMEILEGMSCDAPLIINGDNDLLPKGVAGIPNPVVVCGISCKDADCRAESIQQHSDCMSFVINFRGSRYDVKLPAVGMHNVYNACIAFACGMLLGVTPEQAVRGLSEYVPTGMRQKIVRKGGITVIEDCYNASPDSIKASLRVLRDLDCTRRIAVLGDMKELGSYSRKAHLECGKAAAENGIDVLLAYGPEAKVYLEGAEGVIPTALHFDDKQELVLKLCSMLQDGDAILFKASRAMKLEEAIESVYEVIAG